MKLSWRKILVLFLFVALTVYIAITLNFASSKNKDLICNKINVHIGNQEELSLVTPKDIVDIIKQSGEKVISMPVKDIATYKLEQLLASKSFIKTVSVYTTIDGALNIKLMQRIPVVRIHTPKGAFYMDNEGFVFPLSTTYAHYVPVVTGDVQLPFTLPYRGELPNNERSKTLRDLLSFISFLEKDSFWNAEIEQINILSNSNVELIPRTGNHIVQLGTFDGYQYKLKKLYTFYKKALPVEGWSKYATLDLRFSNQVVATLK